MATGEVFFGPAPLSAEPSSLNSSPRSSIVSSESPRTSSSVSFSVILLSDGQQDDDISPKIEELDDGSVLSSAKAQSTITDAESGDVTPKDISGRRPRGRPRKHPKTEITPIGRAPKGRSKTGCITCRRRKKKCDETKPACLHCQKNNVHCEGYPPKEIWQSGKQKALIRGQQRKSSVDLKPLPSLIEGIETELDWYFFDHFNTQLSKVLSLSRERMNPFQELLLPMATAHRGLMHSLLSLSGAHLVNQESNTTNSQMVERMSYHFDFALRSLQDDENLQKKFSGDIAAQLTDPTVAQVIVLCLKTICAGDTDGEYRFHLDAGKALLQTHISANEDFQRFLYEFLVYHDLSNSITSDRPSLFMMDDFELPEFVGPEAGVFLGVCDGLFGCISQIRQLRDRIRDRRRNNERPDVDYLIIADGRAIDAELNTRRCNYDIDDPQWACWQVYRTCAWLYLHRTINPSTPNEQLRMGVDEAIAYVQSIPADHPVQSVLLTPVFIVGCSAFVEEQRAAILESFDVLQNYSNLGNIKYAKHIVQKIWEMMDAGDEKTWDWEWVMKAMGWDLLIT